MFCFQMNAWYFVYFLWVICLLEIDIQGAKLVQEKTDCNCIFITSTGGIETLRERLEGRGNFHYFYFVYTLYCAISLKSDTDW